jgi:hypothetical protein
MSLPWFEQDVYLGRLEIVVLCIVGDGAIKIFFCQQALPEKTNESFFMTPFIRELPKECLNH